jgi:glyceraldehyde 3-phosphate dehydrogenase|tara:strand:- start:464 stop:1474 length:1011 start_codon:yes stop_codon:yes gene_type:complete
MAINVAISGFGRIGRLVLRSIIENKRKDINIVAINDLAPVETNAFLLSYDSIHGPLKEKVNIKNGHMIVGKKKIAVLKERDPKQLPWKKLKIDIVFECTGLFTSKETASMHLTAGAKKVLVSAPCSDADKTIVYGVNHETLTKKDTVVSNASCTTNCLAPVTKVLNDNFGIVHGYMTTIHAYTGDQKVLDTFHSDPRRARAAALSMIPTSTGAAKAVGLVMPELAGKLDGSAIRVPTPNVSLIDFKFVTKNKVTANDINKAMTKASKTKNFKRVLTVNSEPLVSSDFNHNPASSNFDLTQTQVIDGTFGRVLSWYDNEWGFSNRMCDTAIVMSKSK